MHEKPTVPHHTDNPHPLRAMSSAEFAQLGAETVVFARHVSGDELVEMVPAAAQHADDPNLILLMSASGQPLLVADTYDAVNEWLEDKPLNLVSVH